ncbi:hypothetical protein PILCRDRAFT_12456 [Piloderma croceum F 1598]|uniref:Protein kinase domain-containing protein n=1 Tax=Piloderma croceum (strain F 1598) TaxID=765440 RepID=A0A0C3FAH7_PILCF|nr:hypothetical protein PILCRDRAFT_12456 [Piloderma croceum F 1598]
MLLLHTDPNLSRFFFLSSNPAFERAAEYLLRINPKEENGLKPMRKSAWNSIPPRFIVRSLDDISRKNPLSATLVKLALPHNRPLALAEAFINLHMRLAESIGYINIIWSLMPRDPVGFQYVHAGVITLTSTLDLLDNFITSDAQNLDAIFPVISAENSDGFAYYTAVTRNLELQPIIAALFVRQQSFPRPWYFNIVETMFQAASTLGIQELYELLFGRWPLSYDFGPMFTFYWPLLSPWRCRWVREARRYLSPLAYITDNLKRLIAVWLFSNSTGLSQISGFVVVFPRNAMISGRGGMRLFFRRVVDSFIGPTRLPCIGPSDTEARMYSRSPNRRIPDVALFSSLSTISSLYNALWSIKYIHALCPAWNSRGRNPSHMLSLLSTYFLRRTTSPGVTFRACPTSATSKDFLSFIESILQGLNFLHSCGIVHLDIDFKKILVNQFAHTHTYSKLGVICDEEARICLRNKGQIRYCLFEKEEQTTAFSHQLVYAEEGHLISFYTDCVNPELDPFKFDVAYMGNTLTCYHYVIPAFYFLDRMTTEDVAELEKELPVQASINSSVCVSPESSIKNESGDPDPTCSGSALDNASLPELPPSNEQPSLWESFPVDFVEKWFSGGWGWFEAGEL